VADSVTIVVLPVLTVLPVGFETLRDEAHDEGHTHMARLAADWATGANRFGAADEALLAAFVADTLVGVGGMTIDPADKAALRMRRFYVRPAFRRHGIGRHLADALMTKARQATNRVVLNAETELAARFWEALGFVPDRRDGHTHVLPKPTD
jgi:GNAT superfamily N-acetyltransferase